MSDWHASEASAPPEGHYEQKLYPAIQEQSSVNDFRFAKINEISATFEQEVSHYRIVAKKYKRAKKLTNWLAGGSSAFSGVLSVAGLGSALSIIGLPAAIPLGAVSAVFAVFSSCMIVGGRKLESKIKKHREIVTLAVAKRDTVSRLVSQALVDRQISDQEFQIILSELERYNALKEKIRAKLTRQPSKKNVDVDVDRIRQEIREEVGKELKADFQKKVGSLLTASN